MKLSPDEVAARLAEVPDWEVVDSDPPRLRRTFRFPDFASATRFVDAVAAMADQADHHPEITLSWGRVTVSWWTHDCHGLSDKDFRAAARCDALA